MALYFHERLPFSIWQRSCGATDEELEDGADCVGEDFWVEAFVDGAGVFMGVAPGAGLACLEDTDRISRWIHKYKMDMIADVHENGPT